MRYNYNKKIHKDRIILKIIDLKSGIEISATDLPLACAIGNFDGVHIGHRKLIEAAVGYCRAHSGTKCAVFTFESNTSGAPFIVSHEEKLKIFAECGAEIAVTVPFDEVRGMSCESFVSEILIDMLNVACAFCGFNFRFGKMGAGNGETLAALMESHGRSAAILPPVNLGGEPVSSTRIRVALAEGDMALANSLLGRNFGFVSEVLHGKALGATLGFPTANQRIAHGAAVPRHGVYASLCIIDGKKYPAVSNIGVRPSIDSHGETNCETNIIGFSGDLYGREIAVYPLAFIRPERRFSGVAELTAEVFKNRTQAEEMLKKMGISF